MADNIDTLADALPREILRVTTEILPAYDAIGNAGVLGKAFIVADLAKANKAVMEQDIVAMIQSYNTLKEIQ